MRLAAKSGQPIGRRQWLLALSVVLGAFAPCFSQTPSRNLFFWGWNEQNAEEKFRRFSDYLDELEAKALDFLKDDGAILKSPRTTYCYIKYLERIRSVRAVPRLSEMLVYRKQGFIETRLLSFDELFPCYGALSAIGLPGATGLVKRVAMDETSPEYRKLCFYAIFRVVGPKHVKGLIDEVLPADKAKDERAQRRLQTLKDEYDVYLLKTSP